LEKRLRMRPAGVASKNERGARMTCASGGAGGVSDQYGVRGAACPISMG
jgi:hypothetical protein